MDEIRYLSEGTFFGNKSGNPYQLQHLMKKMHRLVNEFGYSVNSPVFIYYLDRAAEDMVVGHESEIGPNPMKALPYALSCELNNVTEFSDDEYSFLIFYVLVRLHHELYDYDGARKLLERYESEFQNQPYYGKIKAVSLLNSNDPEDQSTAVDTAFSYSQNHRSYPELHKVFAESIVELLDADCEYLGSVDAIPTDTQELLQLATREIDWALESDNFPAEYLVVKARTESLSGKYDSAIESISRAIRELSRSRIRYTELRAEFGRIKNRIEMRRQQAELDKRATDIADSVTELRGILDETEKSVNQLNMELDDIRRDFQRTFLEFLGFFSAIIAVIVITGQIALEFTDPSEAGRLMILSYGGLLFAFGGFSAILSSEYTERRNRSLLALAGFVIAVLALYANEIISFANGLIS